MTRWAGPLLAVALAVTAAVRVTATYRVYNQTWDEPAHMVAGLEWLQRGSYTFEPLHPPLARVLTAIGPHLAGARLEAGDPNPWSQGNRILGAGEAYDRTLALARAGILPFLLLASAGVYVVGRRALGSTGGVLAVLLFSTLPPVLAHAGLATTDLALAAGTILSFAAFLWWRESPSTMRGVVLGLALGGTVLTKFSSLLFLPVVLGAAMVVRGGAAPEATRRDRVRALRPVWITALALIWLGYRGSIGPVLPSAAVQDTSLAARVAQVPIYPAPALIQGLAAYAAQSSKGRKAYFMGRRGREGWWLFFPTLLALKTPIPLLTLAVIGTAAAMVGRSDTRRRVTLAASLAAAGILLVLLPSRVNIGLRHALAVYPFLAIAASGGARELWHRGRRHTGAALVLGLVGWQLFGSLRAAPDFLPYFNELARGAPERYVVDSDLDWGQDLKRLADTLHARGITNVALAYNGSADPTAVGIDRYRILRPFTPDTGWIAISLFAQKLGYWNEPTSDDFAWLDRFQPVARAGTSILLYRIDRAPIPSK